MSPFAPGKLGDLQRISRFLLGKINRKRRSRRPAFKLFLEPLEDRTLPSGIFGSVWNDLLADGIRSETEPAVAAISLTLEQNGIQIQQTTTNGAGNYSFSGLAAGTYTVALAIPVGASLTFPNSSSRTVQVGTGNVEGIDFGVDIPAQTPANEDVTSDPAVQQMPSVAVDPLNPNHVVIAYMDGGQKTNGYAGIGIAVSHDGGATFQHRVVPLPSGYDEAAGHPTVQFDDQGHFFVSYMAAKFLGTDSSGKALKPSVIYDTATQVVNGVTVSRRSFGFQANNGVFVARSNDDGATWSTAAVASHLFTGSKVFFETQPDLAIDTTPTSANYGSMYMVWTRFYPLGQFPGNSSATRGGTEIMMAVSKDGGATWTTQKKTNGFSVIRDPLVGASTNTTAGVGSSTLPRITVGPQGDLYVSMFAGNRFPVFYSSNGGTTFRNPDPGLPNAGAAPFDRFRGYPFGLDDDRYTAVYVAGASSPSFIPRATLFNNSFRTQAVRAIAADPSRPGTIYAVEAVQVLSTSGTILDAGEITFSRSTDHGLTWQAQFTVGANTGNFSELASNLQFRYRSALNDDDATRFIGFDSTLQDEVIAGQALPALSVDKNGNIAVIWYDTRRDPANKLLDVYGTVSTDGGKTFSANNRITSASFNADNGKFTDGVNGTSFYLGDHIGLALVNGTAYAAWTDTRSGSQDIDFSRYAISPAPTALNDRFEKNDTPATFTDLGKITAQRVVPRLNLDASDNDFFRLEAGATGDLVVTATGANVHIDLLDATGTTVLASDTDTVQSGKVVGQQISFHGIGGTKYQVHVTGSGSYSLVLQSLTADLGTHVTGSADGSISSGSQAVYRLVSAVGGSLELTLSSGNNVVGNLNLQVLSADGQTVLASGTPTGSPGNGEIERISLAVDQGQAVLIQVLGTTGSSGSFRVDFSNLDLFETSRNGSLSFPTGESPANVKVGDVNGDGRPDLILTSTQGADQVQVMLGNGDGTFQAPRSFAVGSGQAAVSAREPLIGDFNGDNVPDLVVPNYFSADVSVLLGNGDGTFAPQRRSDATFKGDSLAAGDFNGDGKLDLAVLNRTTGATTVALLLGRGDGTFLPPDKTTIDLARGDASPLRAGDLNGDGKTDLVVFAGNDTHFQVLFGNGAGSFTLGGSFSSGEALLDAQLTDVNGDGKLDAIIGGSNLGNVFLLLGNGDGTFQNAQSYSTAKVNAGDNVLIVGMAVVDYNGDGRLDVVATTKSRNGADVPHAFLLPGIAASGGKLFGAAQDLGTIREAGRIAVTDFNGDGFKDIAIIETGGVRVLYGKNPTIVANTSPQNARNLGTVVHFVGQPEAIVPGFSDAYFKLTVPGEAAAGAGDQVVDLSALFTNLEGAGLKMEVIDASGTVHTGDRTRVIAKQGDVLTIHITGTNGTGYGVYTLDVDVLPQVVSVQAESLLPGGPVTSLVITFQGDRLDAASAENAGNYKITNIDTGEVVAIHALGGAKAVVYNPGANVTVSSGHTFLTNSRQTVTLLFDEPLDPGSYRIELSSAIRTADVNAGEASSIAHAPGFGDHTLVTAKNGQITEGRLMTTANLVVPNGPLGDFSSYANGTPALTQLHNDLGSELDVMLNKLGDDPTITTSLNQQILARFFPGWESTNESVSFLIIWLDPVSIDLADPGGNRAVYNLQTGAVAQHMPKTFVEVGGNVEVIVMAGVTGSFQLQIADVQATARGGAILLTPGQTQSVALTDAMRDGQTAFNFNMGPGGLPSVVTFVSNAVNSLAADARAGLNEAVAGLLTSAIVSLSVSAPAVGTAADSKSEPAPEASPEAVAFANAVHELREVAAEVRARIAELGGESIDALQSYLAEVAARLEQILGREGLPAPAAVPLGSMLPEVGRALWNAGRSIANSALERLRMRLLAEENRVPRPAASDEGQSPPQQQQQEQGPESEQALLRNEKSREDESTLSPLVVAAVFASAPFAWAGASPLADKEERRKFRRRPKSSV